MSSQPLSDRVAIVTGASSGLGAHFASVLAAAGARVVAAARRLERLEELAGAGSAIYPVRCDVTDDEDRAHLVATALDRFGHIDVCVNNAGMSSGGPERQSTLDAFQAVMRLNVDAVFALSQAVAEPMRAQGSGSVINISSMFGFVASAPVPDAGYVASKSAVNGLTRELAAQWARDGVRVNAIAPRARPTCGTPFQSRTSGRLRSGGSSATVRWAARAGSRSWTALSSFSRPTRPRTAPDR